MELNQDPESFFELLGCYLHPSPVLSILLSTHGDVIHICVLCGVVQDRNRTLFIYKVSIKAPKGGCPSFLGYTSIILPDSSYAFSREVSYYKFISIFTVICASPFQRYTYGGVTGMPSVLFIT